MALPRIELIDVTTGYNGEPLIRDLNIVIENYGVVQILGPNGAGKTTLIRTILGLIRPIKGKIIINKEDVTGDPGKAGKYAGYVPQITHAPGSRFPITVWEMVECCLLMREKWPRIPRKKHRERVAKVLKSVGLDEKYWHRNFWELSGGQRQRGFIARALVTDPPIIVMDEPLSSIDPAGRAELARRIGEMGHDHLLIITSHDPMLLLPYTNYIIMVNKGVYIAGPPNEVLTIENTRKIYGEAAIPVMKHVHIADSHY